MRLWVVYCNLSHVRACCTVEYDAIVEYKYALNHAMAQTTTGKMAYSDEELSRQRTRKCRLKGWFQTEAITIIKLAWPTAVAYILQQVIFIVSVAFCGHIDATSSVPLDAAAFAVSVINITGTSLGIGLATALDTLATQAWGAKNYHKVGVYLQRCILIFALAMAPVYGLWFNIESVLNLLHQPPCVVEQATDYIHIYSASLPAVFLFILLQRYLQAQNIVWPFILTGLAANAVSALFHYLLIFVAGMGIRGAATSVVLSNYAFVGVLLVIIYVRKLHRKTWGGWSRESLKDWFQIVRYGFPGFVMIAVEWWTFEIGIFVTGYLADSEIQQGIYAILINYATIVFMVTYALSVALAIRVGNELGAGNVKAAKQAVFVGMVFISGWVLLLVVATLAFKSLLPRLFTSDSCLLAAVAVPMFVITLSVGFDSVQGSLGGVIRASGKQLLGSFINVFTYWVFGLPLGTVLTIVAGLGATGYWIGLTCAPFLQAVLYSVVLLSMNWRKESEKAQRMAGKASEQTDSSELVRFHVEGEGEGAVDGNGNSHGNDDSSKCDGHAVANGLSHTASVEENETHCGEDDDNLVQEEVDAIPLLPNGSAKEPQSAMSSSRSIELSKEKISSNLEATSSMPNHCNHTLSVNGSDFGSQHDDDLLPLISEDEDGVSSWGRSEEEESCHETESDMTVRSKPAFNTHARVSLQTIVLRVATLFAFLVLLTVAVTISQLYVYPSSIGPCLNSTIALNVSVNVTHAQPVCSVY